LLFPLETFPKKFRPDPSTFYLVIVVTNKQTNIQTNAGDYIIPRESFRGDNKILIVTCEIHQFHLYFSHGVLLRSLEICL